MGLREKEQVKIRVSEDFMGFFRKLIANEQLRYPGKRVTHKSILEKALLQYARRNHPTLTPKELQQ